MKRPKPTRQDVLGAIDEAAIVLLAYVQSCSPEERTRLVGVLPALAEIRAKFEHATES